MWCASTPLRCVQPGKQQPPSRLRRARRTAGGIDRVLRPTDTGRPARSISGTIDASHAILRTVSVASGGH